MSFTVPVNVLPSKGRGYKIDQISLRPFTYRQLLDYSRLPHSTVVQRVRRDMELLSTDVDLKEVSLLDFDALVLLKKCISYTQNKDMTFDWINEAGKIQKVSINADNVDWTEYPDELYDIKSIILGGEELKVKIPTVNDFAITLNKMYLPRGDESDYKIAVLLSSLGFNDSTEPSKLEKTVSNAIWDEILLLDHFYSLLSGTIKKVKVVDDSTGKEVEVSISVLATDMFQCLRLNQTISEHKIIYKSKSSSRHN